MLIAIDFDETLTADARLWKEFIGSAQRLGHRIICVTARRQTAENIEIVEGWIAANSLDLPVYFTQLASKVEYMERVWGMRPDIWIDDDPRRCAMGH